MENSNLKSFQEFSNSGEVEWPRRQVGAWSDEKVGRHFMTEIHKRVLELKYQWTVHQDAEDADFLEEHGETFQQWCESKGIGEETWNRSEQPEMDFFESCFFRFDRNSVDIILPSGNLRPEMLRLFEGTTMAWSKPTITAEIYEDEPRVVVNITLVDFWDDARQIKWEYETSMPRIPRYGDD